MLGLVSVDGHVAEFASGSQFSDSLEVQRQISDRSLVLCAFRECTPINVDVMRGSENKYSINSGSVYALISACSDRPGISVSGVWCNDSLASLDRGCVIVICCGGDGVEPR